MLQRFYHQQSQLREKEANGQAYNSPSQVSHSQLKAEYEKRINELNEKEHHQSNPFLRQLPKLTHKLNPFKQQSPKLNARDEPLYANSHIPVYQKHYHGHYDAVPKENTHLQRIPVNPPADIYSDQMAFDDKTPNEYKNVYNATTTSCSVGKEKKSNGTKNGDDPGMYWPNGQSVSQPHAQPTKLACNACSYHFQFNHFNCSFRLKNPTLVAVQFLIFVFFSLDFFLS